MLLLIGKIETTTGFCVHSDLMMSFLLLFVAVAVNAIMLTSSGMTDLTSPSLENHNERYHPYNSELLLIFVNIITGCELSLTYYFLT